MAYVSRKLSGIGEMECMRMDKFILRLVESAHMPMHVCGFNLLALVWGKVAASNYFH